MICRLCKQDKPIGSFGLDDMRPRNTCNICRNNKEKAYYKKNRVEICARNKERYRQKKEAKELKIFREIKELLKSFI